MYSGTQNVWKMISEWVGTDLIGKHFGVNIRLLKIEKSVYTMDYTRSDFVYAQ